MSRPAPIHICYYSNYCKWSEAFIQQLKDTPYVGHFHFVCVDPGPKRPANLPSWLKQTPTLVIRGESEPRIDGEVMNWLYEQKMKDSSDGSKGQGGAGANAELQPYMAMEMGYRYDDRYSFIGGADGNPESGGIGGGGGSQLQHNFTFLNGQDGVGTREASSIQMTSSNDKLSKKAQMLDQQYKMYMQDRDAGMPKAVARQ